MGIFDNYTKDLPEEFRHLKSPYAIFLADRLNLSRIFWGLVLARPTPSSFNSAGGLAIRQFVELVLPRMSPKNVIRTVGGVIANPNSTWSSLGLSQVSEDTVGQPLTFENKMELLQILEESSAQFLIMAATEIIVALGHIQYEYGYGFLPIDIFQQNLSYGYGFRTEFPDYFSLITAFNQEATSQISIPSFFMEN